MARARPIGFFREATFLWEGQVSLFSEPLLLSEFQIKSVQKRAREPVWKYLANFPVRCL